MKKLLSFILLLCLFIPCSFILTACKDTNEVVELKILLNGEELSFFECNWDNIDGNKEVISKEDITILKIYEDKTEVTVFLRDCTVNFKNGTIDLTSLNFWESGESEETQPGTYTIKISNSGVFAEFDVKINKMNRAYGDVALKNGTDILGYGGFDNTYTIDWNYNQFKNLSLSGVCEVEPYGEDVATISHYFVDKTSYDNAEDKSAYYQSNKTLCYPDFTTMPIGTYYIFAEFSETTYYNAGISNSPLCLTLNARNFNPVKTTLNISFDTNKLIDNNKLKENAESINFKYLDIQKEIDNLFPQFDNYGITAFEKLSYYVYENNTWKKINNNDSNIKVNAVNIGSVYYLVKYDFENQKWLRVSTSAEVDENYIEVVNYSQLQEYQANNFVEIPLYCMFNSSNLDNNFYYSLNVDEIFALNLTIKKAQINSIDANLGTFIIQNPSYNVKPDITNAIDKLMIANNNENVKYLYTYPNCLDGITPGLYNTTVSLINNPNIGWNMVRNFNFNVVNKDTINPVIDILNYNSYNRNITADFSKEIKLNVSFNSSDNTINVNVLENENNLQSFKYNLAFKDKTSEYDSFKTITNSTFTYSLSGTNVLNDNNCYIIKNFGVAILSLQIFDDYNNIGTSEIEFNFFNVVDDSSDEKPILNVDVISDANMTINQNTIYINPGVVNFDIDVLSINGSYDYTSSATILITFESQKEGVEYSELGNYAYRFDEVGSFIITINAELDDGRKTTNKYLRLVVEKEELIWLGSFDEIPKYAMQGQTVYLPYISASAGAVVTVEYREPGDVESQPATTTTHNGMVCWCFTTSQSTKGAYKIVYTATSEYDVLTKTISIKVGDNIAPTITIQNTNKLQQDVYFDGIYSIRYVLEVNKKDKTFVVKIGSNVYDLGLSVLDNDDSLTGSNINMSWTNLQYQLTGDYVLNNGITTIDNTTITNYLIKGFGRCCLTLTIKDSYDNVKTEKIYFNVVEKLEQDEEEIEEINSYKSYIVSTNGTGEFNIEDLNIMPGTYLQYTLISNCEIDGILCETTFDITRNGNIIKLANGDNNAYIILKVTKPGNGTYKDYSQYIQIKIYR